MQYEEFLAFVKGRRTVRAIKPDPLPPRWSTSCSRRRAGRRPASTCSRSNCWSSTIPELRAAIRRIVDDYKNTDFFDLEATREPWQGSPWTIETHGRWETPAAPVMIAVLGDTRRRVGLPMAARYAKQKGDSIFESSLANAFLYLLLAAHSLGLAAVPVLRGQVPDGARAR